MSRREFMRWGAFYELFPFDDMHRLHRPAALVSTSFAGGDLKQRLDWLSPEPSTSHFTEADLATMKAFGYDRKGS